MNDRIHYREGYKYQLSKAYAIQVEIRPELSVNTDFIRLSEYGYLFIKEGYAWDGPSGPTFDTKDFMRGSLVHDALYQLMSEGKLSLSHKDTADLILRRICLEDGMPRIRAWWVYWAVRLFGRTADDPLTYRPVLIAPR